ncbi:hypothetical protein [Nitrosomonas sp. Nm166]|uniref:hypothetical protein n=1 Tax=Nitrosomonas sp. Nm166 TaxID=1881054 RepID=UPI000B894DE9|nr:hypothetical protein [Nitrosomonas sp. Nm166]
MKTKEPSNSDKKDAAEKVPTGEVMNNSAAKDLYELDENSDDLGPNTSVPVGSDPDKAAR